MVSLNTQRSCYSVSGAELGPSAEAQEGVLAEKAQRPDTVAITLGRADRGLSIELASETEMWNRPGDASGY